MAAPLLARAGVYAALQVALFLGARTLLEAVGLAAEAAGIGPGWLAPGSFGSILAAEALWGLLSLALTAVFWLRFERQPWTALGLRLPRGCEWGAGLALGLAPLLVPQSIAFLTGHTRAAGPISPDPLELGGRAAGLIALSVVIAFAEELPFRGYLLPVLARCWGAPAAALATSALFWGIHIPDPVYREPANACQVLLLGLGLAGIRLGGGALALPILVHAAYDLTLFVVAGHPRVPGLLRVEHGPPDPWLGGASRAGWLEVAAALVWSVAVWRAVSRRSRMRAPGGSNAGPVPDSVPPSGIRPPGPGE